jgi:hypothetical protein
VAQSPMALAGDLTHDELVAIANSMKAYGDVDEPLTPGFGNQPGQRDEHPSKARATLRRPIGWSGRGGEWCVT